jgi:hypothetical protein
MVSLALPLAVHNQTGPFLSSYSDIQNAKSNYFPPLQTRGLLTSISLHSLLDCYIIPLLQF